ncbi:MAG: hypothetical protein ABIR98_12570 [Usitatibacter sp.]
MPALSATGSWVVPARAFEARREELQSLAATWRRSFGRARNTAAR